MGRVRILWRHLGTPRRRLEYGLLTLCAVVVSILVVAAMTGRLAPMFARLLDKFGTNLQRARPQLEEWMSLGADFLAAAGLFVVVTAIMRWRNRRGGEDRGDGAQPAPVRSGPPFLF